MERNDEEHLGVSRPVVVVGAGQKVAGWMLRLMGVLILFGGGLGFALASVFVMVGLSDPDLMDMDPWWVIPVMFLVCLGVMAVGTAMGVFGMMVAGSFGDLSGERFIKWAMAMLLRNLALLCGMLLVVASVAGAATFLEWRLLALLLPGGILVLVGMLGSRLMRRVMAMR